METTKIHAQVVLVQVWASNSHRLPQSFLKCICHQSWNWNGIDLMAKEGLWLQTWANCQQMGIFSFHARRLEFARRERSGGRLLGPKEDLRLSLQFCNSAMFKESFLSLISVFSFHGVLTSAHGFCLVGFGVCLFVGWFLVCFSFFLSTAIKS